MYWDGNGKEVRVKESQNHIVLTIDKSTALINNREIVLDYPAIIYNNLTYVPLKFISENINTTVVYAPALDTEYTSIMCTVIS